jgi:hypothetical protein
LAVDASAGLAERMIRNISDVVRIGGYLACPPTAPRDVAFDNRPFEDRDRDLCYFVVS